MKHLILILVAAVAIGSASAQQAPKAERQVKTQKTAQQQKAKSKAQKVKVVSPSTTDTLFYAPGAKTTIIRTKEIRTAAAKREYKFVVPWKMIWHEEFNTRKINQKNWDTIPRGSADWNRYMSRLDTLYELEKGKLILRGMRTPAGADDTSKYVTGGLYTKGKFNFQYGKVDICARVQSAKGAWPALWMLPDVEWRKWPDQGEIDIMEHLNFEDSVYQTLHSNYTVTHGIKDNPPHGGRAAIDKEEYNVYTIEWSPEQIVWLVNDVPTFEYCKLKDEGALEKGQWPFDEVFYILLSQQLGGPGTWVGQIDDQDLPVLMYIDYIRVYQL